MTKSVKRARRTKSAKPARIPGRDMLGFGYDVFASEYCVASRRRGQNGQPLLNGLDLSPDVPYDEVECLDRTFRYPKQTIDVITEQPRQHDYTIYARSVEEYISQLTLKANMSGEVGAFSASVKTSYSQSRKTYLENVYAEYGRNFSAIGVRLAPSSAKGLRALLKHEVKEILEKSTPADIIARFGTHLVTGVMIGGKARLRQFNSR